jgi:dTDP-4-dehydrorhamnose reductase
VSLPILLAPVVIDGKNGKLYAYHQVAVHRRWIAILGSQGQLGAELCRQLAGESIPLSRAQCDITDFPATREALVRLSPDAVINAAAYTKVDLAESNPGECFRLNADAVANLSSICGELDVPLVQISTDYVFCGDSARSVPCTEDEPPCPNGVYAQSKLAGEQAAAMCQKHLIVRTCGLYGPNNKPNFVNTMLRLGRERKPVRVVADQRCTPSYVFDVATGAIALLRLGAGGIYHIANGGDTTWYEFAVEVFRAARLSIQVEAITTAQYGAAAPRPSYSVLSTAKYSHFTRQPLPNWRAALHKYLASLNQSANAA